MSEVKFPLTLEYAQSLVEPLAKGDLGPFMGVIDPDVRWRIASEDKDPKKMTGVYRLLNEAPPALTIQYLQTVGNRIIMEIDGEAVQKNGNPYAWFFIFSEETGKVVEIHEYCDTALVQEVVQTALVQEVVQTNAVGCGLFEYKP
ncbi:hypothetical protein FB45DRAFT_1008614 [Roridomyces roridus]|uniref:Uncharacterized protein n=1 Tax=Roridomyces roridus TaxID=1738132 RepID=A0AAD7BA01_9AGAR|nr:hypothetical protein FB45DRAFT_1008614 [Roridomyces roridus]